ncbi:MAG: hypothetical protein HY983_04090 [Candidatus Magasanikbacteria bacterium]|nr:hypothetical protein [Candidatus Magasanikbacteria bacterium]
MIKNMKDTMKKISWIILSVMITTAASVYICPTTALGNSMAMGTSPSLCQPIESASSNMSGAVSCLSSHLSAIGQFIGDTPYVISLLLALGLFTAVFRLFFRNFLTAIIWPLFSRLRHRYLYYRTLIKLLTEKKLLRYLNFLGNHTVASHC